jgi:hypothetical protein
MQLEQAKDGQGVKDIAQRTRFEDEDLQEP